MLTSGTFGIPAMTWSQLLIKLRRLSLLSLTLKRSCREDVAPCLMLVLKCSCIISSTWRLATPYIPVIGSFSLFISVNLSGEIAGENVGECWQQFCVQCCELADIPKSSIVRPSFQFHWSNQMPCPGRLMQTWRLPSYGFSSSFRIRHEEKLALSHCLPLWPYSCH